MNVGDTFVAEDAQGARYECEVVETGRMRLSSYQGRSSVCEGDGRQPAKPIGTRRTSCNVVTTPRA